MGGPERGWIPALIGRESFDRLAEGLPGSALQSLLHAVLERRAAARSPAEILGQQARDRFCAPAAVDARVMNAVEAELFAAAEGFEALELSPVAPLGACSRVALTSQNRVLSALRGTEILADPTNALALECALRLRARPDARPAAVHLACCPRVLRAQPVPKVPGFAQHFRIFALGSGGVEERDHAFTVGALARHITAHLAALDRLEARGFSFGRRRVELLATEARAALGDRVAAAVGASRSTLGHPYYSGGLRFMIWVEGADGSPIPLIDGGAFDWLATLCANRRAVFVGSGSGAQLIAARFGPGSPG